MTVELAADDRVDSPVKPRSLSLCLWTVCRFKRSVDTQYAESLPEELRSKALSFVYRLFLRPTVVGYRFLYKCLGYIRGWNIFRSY